MKIHEVNSFKRLFFVHLGKGEKLLEGIEQACRDNGVRQGAVLSGIGSARCIRYHRIATVADDPTNEYLQIDGPTEICALQGLIIDGVPHLHIACCSREQAFGGHLEPGSVVQYLAEICIADAGEETLTRRTDAFGIEYIDWK